LAAREARDAIKKEERRAEGEQLECEHGIMRCKICFPPVRGK
jgi:hypothetical protein